MLRHTLFLLAALAMLLGLWLVLRPPAPPTTVPDPAGPGSTPAAAAPVRSYRLHLSAQPDLQPAAALPIRQGETVVLQIRADFPDHVHLHGYDREVAVQPGAVTELRFTADKAGQFELEAHDADRVLAILLVQPHPL